MLINATQKEELRMAMVDGQRLYDLNIELPSGERKKANIYKGTITRIEPSLEAAFVNYGAERHGFLPLKEISSEYFISDVEKGGKPNIKEVLKEGQDIVVQIDKEERGNKGAALTTYVSLAGRFIVLKPNKARSGGVSRRIMGDERDLARESLLEIEVPKGMSVILRTAGIDRSGEELAWDLDNLLAVWEAIKKVVVERPSPFLIYRESNAIVRALRDYLTNEIGEILIDDEKTFEQAQEFVDQVMPHNQRKLKHYTDPVPLFTRYQIETQIESAFAHSVTLPSGGSLVIDHTEALVSIDINSARATKGGDIEATALNTNLEAAEEIARQLRLRDLGGLIVIDFIDMGPQRNQREVESRLRDSVRMDRARVQIGKITRFGLLEMSRQRLRPSLGESSYLTCPRCSGIGNIRSVESLALAILRIIGEEARKERTAKVIAQLPVEVATYLLNEKRNWVQNLESREDTQVVLVANSALETPHYQVRRVRDDQVELPENAGISYTLTDTDEEAEVPQTMQDRKVAEPAAIATVTPSTPAPRRKKKKGPGLFAWLAGLFGPSSKPKKSQKRRPQKRTRKQSDSRRRGTQRGRRRPDSKKAASGKKPARKKQQSKQRSKEASGDESARQKREPRKDQRSDARPDQKSQPRDKGQDDKRKEARDDAKSDGRKTGSKRRSRGGRRRRRSPEDNEQAKAGNQEKAAGQSTNKSEPTDKPAVAEPVVVSMVPETPLVETSAATDGKESRPASHDDTQPELPVLDFPLDEPRQETAASEPKPEPLPADAPQFEARADAEEPARQAAPDKKAKDNGSDQDKPAGRLLPWEPSETVTTPAAPEAADKDHVE
jgi:ribonuclease E